MPSLFEIGYSKCLLAARRQGEAFRPSPAKHDEHRAEWVEMQAYMRDLAIAAVGGPPAFSRGRIPQSRLRPRDMKRGIDIERCCFAAVDKVDFFFFSRAV